MSAKDYGFYPSALTGTVYLAKKTKSKNVMSSDRRAVDDNEAIGIFEHYLRRWCRENNTDTLEIRDSNGNLVFTAKLNSKNKEE